ncbi:MAG: DEAD/DEAH box helicase [Candidatus Cloacimonetes bacterium]|nr:DEAD/DEAH box helicase [Candidatus Cloacimonadota bacterium]
MNQNFSHFNLSLNAIKAIEKKGFTTPTFIQNEIIPLILDGKKDLLVQAQTGTGKTAAFAIPLIEKIVEKKPNQVLIMAPTRELVIQLSKEIYSFCGRKRIKIALLYGGQSFDSQVKRLKQGAEIVIGTPGRTWDHINRRSYKTNRIDYLIFDEVDEMMKAGFANDIEEILKNSNRNRKTFFFSATIPEKISRLAKVYTKKLEIINTSKKEITTQLTKQVYFEMFSHDKFKVLKAILAYEQGFYGIIFCKTKLKAGHLGRRLAKLGYSADGIHGDLAQDVREQIIGKFRQQKISILTATDVAARGLDIPNLTHIINYSLPQTPEVYVHRIGRTGRAGKEGTAITFITPEDDGRFFKIKKTIKQNIHKLEIEDLKIKEREEEETLKPIEQKKTSRLFIALGTKNSITKQKLLDFLYKNTEIPANRINDVLVAETFSFITTSYEDAEKIIEVFKDKKNGKRKMVELAKPKSEKTKR